MSDYDQDYKELKDGLELLKFLIEKTENIITKPEEDKLDVIKDFEAAQVWAFGKNHINSHTVKDLQEKYISKHGKKDPMRLIFNCSKADMISIYAFELGRLYFKYKDHK